MKNMNSKKKPISLQLNPQFIGLQPTSQINTPNSKQ